MELPKCEICGVRPVFYQRVRSGDVGNLPFTQIPADIKLPVGNNLLDIVRHACGGIVVRNGDKLFEQSPAGNGFIEFRSMTVWKVHKECPEAARLLREMRSRDHG